MLSWEKLLSNKRATKSHAKIISGMQPDQYRTDFESDFDRIIYSEPFRRLAKKTQVHPLAPNDHIHNRLTHSLEVSSVGRSLGKRLVEFLQRKNENNKFIESIPTILQSGCLAHDIGNPPFGHGGEYSIREWFTENELKLQEYGFSEEIISDFKLFEGNAQGFRIAARADNPACGYLRLTYTTLGAMVKYPWDSKSDKVKEKPKYNFFQTESELFTNTFSEMGLTTQEGVFARHPLSFLTEAADDICYRILDMEDAVTMGITPAEPIHNLFAEISKSSPKTKTPLSEARGKAIHELIKESWKIFENDYESIMNGQRIEDLRSDLPDHIKEANSKIKDHYDHIFRLRSKVAYELGSKKAIGRILECMTESIVKLKRSNGFNETPFTTKRFFELTWGEGYTKDNTHQTHDWWLSQAVDYVAGLTDNYAIQLAKEIHGS